MPEGLVKIGTELYKTVLPMVKAQVESQIKVRDLSSAKLSISPADQTSWSEVRSDLIAEKKAALRSELETELSALTDESEIDVLRKTFSTRERAIEHEVDSKIHTFSATLDLEYKCVSKASSTVHKHLIISLLPSFTTALYPVRSFLAK